MPAGDPWRLICGMRSWIRPTDGLPGLHHHAGTLTRASHEKPDEENRAAGYDVTSENREPEEGLEPTTYRLQGGCSTS